MLIYLIISRGAK